MIDNKVENCWTCNLGASSMEYLFSHCCILW